MNLFWAFFLGIIQGLTEFLPVSSSGHLVIVQSLIPGFSQPGVLFDVVLHVGTLLAILIYYRKVIQKISLGYLVLLAIGTIPAVIVGALFLTVIENLFTNVKIVGVALLVTALANYLTDTFKTGRKIELLRESKLVVRESLLVGLAQAFAIIPGISRSGATIFTGTYRGFGKRQAAEFSFLLSVPAVFGASLLQIVKHGFDGRVDSSVYAVGFLAALISGYLAISLVLKLLIKKGFRIFAYYAAILGLLVIIFL